MNAGNLTVTITGDTSGLDEAIDKANARLGILSENPGLNLAKITNGLYATGKKNELFKMEKNVFDSTVKSSHIPITDQLSWWREMLSKYSYDYNVILECNEEIFALTRKLVDSINSVSFTYIDERAYFNDWAQYEDDAILAFNRIKDNNRAFMDAAFITYEGYCDNIKTAGEILYEGRISQSKKWLEHEEKYNGLSTQGYIDGLERMRAYTDEYYNQGLISYRVYADGIHKINDEISDKTREKNEEIYSGWKASADNWYRMRETYGDWEVYGDNEVEYYRRCIERIGELYKNGVIEWQEYSDATMEYNLLLFKAQEAQYDDWLSEKADYISRLKSEFSREEKLLRDTYASDDRVSEISDIKRDISIYRNAVTKTGQDKYESLQKELKKLEREEELYRLEQEHQQTLDELQAEYEVAERRKKEMLWQIKNTSIDVMDICNNIQFSSGEYQKSIITLIKDAIEAINNVSVEVYNDNSTHTTDVTLRDVEKPRYEIAHGYYG